MKQNFISLNVAIIGAGPISESLAAGLLSAGHKIYFGLDDNNLLISNNVLYQSKDVHVCSVEKAGAKADLIIMTCAPEELRAAAYYLGDVKRKVIIDCVITGGVPKTDELQHMNSINAIRSITGSKHVVKWFYSTGSDDNAPKKMTYTSLKMYMAGDSKKGKMLTNLLARDMGHEECYDLGGSDKVMLMEEMISFRNKKELVKK